jgi:hypothetical protein
MSMDARIVRAVVLTAVLASLGAGYRTPNFVIEASNEGLAHRVGLAAEKYRRELAVLWLNKELPDWKEPCPITVQSAPHLFAGGETSFVFDRGEVFGWRMRVQGTEERILDSVLPHEVTHTVLATHFRRPLPRWADEGACTTVEHASERIKQQNMLVNFLRTKKGIAFSQMFAMKEYPHEILPLYAQGYSLARYLIDQGGRQKFLNYIGEGLKREDWTGATKTYYGYRNLAHLQDSWLEWVKQGSPQLDKASGQTNQLAAADNRPGRKSKTDSIPIAQARFQSDDGATASRARHDNVDRSTFESRGDLIARDQRSRTAEPPLQLAHDNSTGSRAVQSNKRSVYDRGIEPSGNSYQYPFKPSRQRADDERQSVADAAPRTAVADSRREVPLRAAPAAVASNTAGRRQVILEWRREDNR